MFLFFFFVKTIHSIEKKRREKWNESKRIRDKERKNMYFPRIAMTFNGVD